MVLSLLPFVTSHPTAELNLLFAKGLQIEVNSGETFPSGTIDKFINKAASFRRLWINSMSSRLLRYIEP